MWQRVCVWAVLLAVAVAVAQWTYVCWEADGSTVGFSDALGLEGGVVTIGGRRLTCGRVDAKPAPLDLYVCGEDTEEAVWCGPVPAFEVFVP